MFLILFYHMAIAVIWPIMEDVGLDYGGHETNLWKDDNVLAAYW
jgi:hypothetical protein